MEPSYYCPETIATLGDAKTAITCSLDAAKRRYPDAAHQGHSTFENAVAAMKRGDTQMVLVPGAYPDIRHFLMDEKLMVIDTFKLDIPALVYGNMVNDLGASVETIYHHRAVESNLVYLPRALHASRFIRCDSNEVAYEAMVRHGERAGCVSNQLVFDHHNRPSLMPLRTRRDMAWVVFGLAGTIS